MSSHWSFLRYVECVPFLHRASLREAGISYDDGDIGGIGKEGLKKSIGQVTEYLIRPHMVGDEVGQGLMTLQQLAAGESSSQSMENLSKALHDGLSGKNLDPINAILVPLESVNAVHSLFIDNPDTEVDHSPSTNSISHYSRCLLCFRTVEIS